MGDVEVAGRRLVLTYCTNVHAAESVADIRSSLDRVTVNVGRTVFAESPMGVGLWLPRPVVDALAAGDEELDSLRRFLADRGLFAATLNAFPYGGFHQPRVKERVFTPSWAEPARLEYTVRCGWVLAGLLQEERTGPVSTVPVGHRAAGFRDGDLQAAVDNLRLAAAEYGRIEAETGRRLIVCVEPEPTALLGTLDEAVVFLNERVFRGDSDPLRRHLGVCFDACHEAVMFQDPLLSLGQISRSGIVVGKIQVTAALELDGDSLSPDNLARLAAFDEGRYLHQVAVRHLDGRVDVFADLPPFLAALDRLKTPERVRVHFHVPVFADPAEGLRTTRRELPALLRRAVADRLTDLFEVETYTFDVFPEAERRALGGNDLAAALSRELRWTRAILIGA